jgi:hypothetical protein
MADNKYNCRFVLLKTRYQICARSQTCTIACSSWIANSMSASFNLDLNLSDQMISTDREWEIMLFYAGWNCTTHIRQTSWIQYAPQCDIFWLSFMTYILTHEWKPKYVTLWRVLNLASMVNICRAVPSGTKRHYFSNYFPLLIMQSISFGHLDLNNTHIEFAEFAEFSDLYHCWKICERLQIW